MSRFLLASWRDPGKVALDGALAALQSGGNLLDSLVAGLSAAEADESLFLIGRGSLPNSDGEIELDAAIMRGDTLNSGAVCAVRGIFPAIQIARLVMEKTDHLMIAGDQAVRFAEHHGMSRSQLHSQASLERYLAWKQNPEEATDHYTHSASEESKHTDPDHHHGDTVSMIGWKDGEVVAASSTSGLQWKLPGRVGDSPIVGAGLYADSEAGAAAGTGWGEQLWRANASGRVVELMRRGASPQDACNELITWLVRRRPESKELMTVVFAISREGEIGASTTTGEFPLWVWRDGTADLKSYRSPM